MQQGIVLIIGMARRGEFESLEARGLPMGILVDTNNKQRRGDVSKFVVVERFDFSRPLADLVAAIFAIRERHGIQCLYNVNELYVAQTAAAAKALNLAGVSPEAARFCLDKGPMRRRFQERIGPTSSALFATVSSEADLLATAEQFGYPVFLQPANVSASMWATRNETTEALLQNYRAMLAEVPQHYRELGQTNQSLSVVLAEYLEGTNTSIDCVADAEGNVYTTPPVDVLTGRDVGMDDFHHFARIVPSRLSENELLELAELAAAGMKALDMTTCAAHVEFIGRRLGEIAARPGGNRPRILELGYGIDLLYAYYQVLCGQPPQLRATRRRAAAVVTPFPVHTGTFRGMRNLAARLAGLPGLHYYEVRAKPGQRVGLARGGFRAPLYVEMLADDLDTVRRGIDQVASWKDLYEVD